MLRSTLAAHTLSALALAVSLAGCVGKVAQTAPTPAPDGTSLPTADAPPGTTVDAGPPDAAVLDPGVEGDGDFTIGPVYVDAPENTVPGGTPRGDVYHFTMDSTDSAIYPGVTGPYVRDVWVHVPAQHVDGTAAPFMLVQDGGGYRDLMVPILDVMIAARQVPAQITIFIDPGPGDGRGSERGFEYDTVSEAYTTFIETEVLPLVPTVPDLAAAHPGLAFTTDPEGRASMGISSGGSAAFTMGWFRPDLYRRILTYSGTFVNQAPDATYPASAWEYHEHLIAEAAEKPLRVFLEVGQNDNNLDDRFGDGQHDWVVANQRMAAALAARTYHYRFLYALDAGHGDARVLRQTLPDALRWLWRGYPIP